MPRSIPNIALRLSAPLVALAGISLYGSPRSPDVEQGALSLLGAFMIFVFFLAGQFGWGYCLNRLTGRAVRVTESFFWGTGFFCLTLGTLGFFPVLGPAYKAPWFVFCALGPTLAWRWHAKNAVPLDLLPGRTWWAGVAVVAAMLLLRASTPHSFWDSLWYHLTGPRLWFEAGRIHLPEFFPVAYKTGLWDYHFLWAQLLLGSPGDGGGLIAAQVFSQWHTAFTAALCWPALRRVLPGLNPWLLGLAMLGSEIFLVSFFAKNDFGAAFWGILFISFYLERARPPLMGLAAGLTFAAKYTAGFFLLPFFAAELWGRRRDVKACALLGGGFLLAAGPLLLRNYLGTGNPFFPALAKLFGSTVLGPSWDNIKVYEGATVEGAALLAKIASLARDTPIAAGLLLLPLCAKKIQPRPLLAFSLMAAALFLFGSGPQAEWRISGATVMLLAVFGAYATQLALEKVFPARTALAIALVAAFVPVALRGPYLLPRADLATDPALRIREWGSGAAMAWARMHARAEEGVATLNEQRIYYLLPHRPIRAFDWPALDRALSETYAPEDAVRTMRKFGIRYVVLSAEFLDLYYDRRVCDLFYRISEDYPRAVSFRSEHSRVLDLNLLPK